MISVFDSMTALTEEEEEEEEEEEKEEDRRNLTGSDTPLSLWGKKLDSLGMELSLSLSLFYSVSFSVSQYL